MNHIKKITIIALGLLISACSLQAPVYNASMENVQTIKRVKTEAQVNIGQITTPKKLSKISLRGSSMYSPVNKSYGDYLSRALEAELKLAKVWSGVSSTVITGEIVSNDIDVSGFSTGTGEISVNFVMTREGTEIYNKNISANIEFESSFVGAIAIPNGQASYVDLVQALIKNLFEDKSFIKALNS